MVCDRWLCPEHVGVTASWHARLEVRCVRVFARRLEEVLAGLVVHVADAFGRTEFDTVAAVPLDVPRSRVLHAPPASRVY